MYETLQGERRDFGNASHSVTWRTGSLGEVKALSLIVKSNMTGKCIFRGSSFQGFTFSRSAPAMVALTYNIYEHLSSFILTPISRV